MAKQINIKKSIAALKDSRCTPCYWTNVKSYMLLPKHVLITIHV